MQRCTDCKGFKPLTPEFFNRQPHVAYGLSTICKDCRAARNKKRYGILGDKINEESIERQQRYRLVCLFHYGNGILKCACCGETEVVFLSLDHKIGRGKQENLTGRYLYRWLIKNNFPEGYQILCFNCNMGKYLKGVCPHQIIKEVSLGSQNAGMQESNLPKIQIQ